ncbi:hypothetical protein B0I35DRAFT_400300 [Stachybotrys elegans]|uniref:DUF7587 domain-containing protein n=1 Tax=Stachybotrys elegans TaxID=80388 RepID=A0A8K0WL25_9HYPO|nr:hypothetical protein B0I35DRAFT_400300 [Stachybotrys elegans]
MTITKTITEVPAVPPPAPKAEPEQDYLLFQPRGSKEWLREKFDVVPTYLFRVFTSNSAGTTDDGWVKSHEAAHKTAWSKRDIFDWDDDSRVASMVFQHLRYRSGEVDDNLVSWTSSLLYALHYMRILHHKHRVDWSDIKLLVIATTGLPRGVFVRDMDLIDAFAPHDSRLTDFGSLRRRKHPTLSGFYYFGEYISQGALKIMGKAQIVSAHDMLSAGLSRFSPDMINRVTIGTFEWSNEVIRQREGFCAPMKERPLTSKAEIESAICVGRLFGPYRLPVAACLLATLPRQAQDDDVLQAFRNAAFIDEEKQSCSPMQTTIVPYNTLPEVQQFENIRQLIFMDTCLASVKDRLVEVELKLRHSIHQILCATPGVNEPLRVESGVATLVASCHDLHERLVSIMQLGQDLQKYVPNQEPEEPKTAP